MSEEKALCEIDKLDTEHYLYWHGNQLFDWKYRRDNGDYNLFWKDDTVAQGVSKYRIIKIEPIPSIAECRQRMVDMINQLDDADVLWSYLEMVNP